MAPLDYPAVEIPALHAGPEHDTGPVVAIDVDGVVNYGEYLGDEEFPPGVHRVDACLPAWATAEATHLKGHGRWNLHGRLTVDPAHGPWIRSLLDRGVTVVWCTSWESAAPVVYGQLLALPPLPVLILDASLGPKDTSTDAKAVALLEWFPGRPLVWLDDDNEEYRHDRQRWPWRHPTWPTFVPEIVAGHGLTAEVRNQVDRWLAGQPGGPVADVPKLGSCRTGAWRVTTTTGTLRVDLSARTVTPGRSVRSATGLPRIIEASPVVNVGEPLVVRPYSGNATYDCGVVRRIRFLGLGPEADLGVRGRFDRQWPPNLFVARDAQQRAEEAAATYDGVGEVAVKSDASVSVWDGDTPITLELDHGFLRISAEVRDGEFRGKPHYGSQTVVVGQARRVSKDGIIYGDVAVRLMVAEFRAWQRRRTCLHTSGGRYCPDCGANLRSDQQGANDDE